MRWNAPVGTKTHQGIVAFGAATQYADEKDVIAGAKNGSWSWMAWKTRINLGAIVRTAHPQAQMP